MSFQVGRNEHVSSVRPGTLFVNGYRYGYYHYQRDWCDDNFSYPFYVFNPYGPGRCYASPFYYYVSLPGYINSSRVIIIRSSYSFIDDRPYSWHSPSDDRYRNYSDLDYAVDDITLAFEDGNRKALNRLVPHDGRVNILNEDRYSYSLNSDDFYDMFRDAIDNAQTSRYEILSVRENGRSAKVYARHSYIDPWGARTYVYHTYYLEKEDGNFVIREFGTSDRRN